MNAAAEAPTSTIVVSGVRTELIERGNGRPLLFLHPDIGIEPSRPCSIVLPRGRLIAPTHPGFGHSERPAGLTTVDDLAYFYLDLLRCARSARRDRGRRFARRLDRGRDRDQIDGADVALVLADPVGIKVGDRETRDIARYLSRSARANSTSALRRSGAAAATTAHAGRRGCASWRATAKPTARYAWSPYMHDPKLKGRLHRIAIPTLVLWGTDDRIVGRELWARLMRGHSRARFETIEGAGHFPASRAAEASPRMRFAFEAT